MPEVGQILAYGPTAVLLVVILAFLLKIAPVWKEVKLRELDIREGEAGTMDRIAEALGNLAAVLQAIGVDQRRATENISIMQRVNADAEARLSITLQTLSARLETVENAQHREVMGVTDELTTRLEKLENVDATTAKSKS